MATPLIDSVTASPSSVGWGDRFSVTIVAHDPDASGTAGTSDLTVTVTDAAGNAATSHLAMPIGGPGPVTGNLTYSLTDTDNAGFTITQRVDTPHVFDCIAPTSAPKAAPKPLRSPAPLASKRN